MDDLPYGARHLFERQYQIPGCDYLFEHDSKHLEVIRQYECNTSRIIKPLYEVDQLLESDWQWQSFCLQLIETGFRFSRVNADNERNKRRQVTELRKKIGAAANNLFNLLLEYSQENSDDPDSYGFYYDVGLDNLELILWRAADFHNKNFNRFQLVPCEYDQDFSRSIRELINSQNRVCMPATWAVVGAIADEFEHNAYFKYERLGGDPLSFSQQTSKADYIRGLTNQLKLGIKVNLYPKRLMDLSFSSITSLAEVFYPYGGARADQVIDKDWNPKKDSAKVKKRKTATK